MVFQALAQYQLSMSHNKDEFLDVSVQLPTRSNNIHWRITYENAMVSRIDQVTMAQAKDSSKWRNSSSRESW